MNKIPKILQGTDGIRAKVIRSSEREVNGLSPLDAYLQFGVLTEEFMELYTYTQVTYLISSGVIKEGDPVVIGWDPRDKEGIFTKKAVLGIQKAGADALVAGIVPTPVIPLFMSYVEAQCGFMITASHNPYDQNGIKIFLLPHGLKMLPEDDETLSQLIYEQDYVTIKSLAAKGAEVDSRERVNTLFYEFMTDKKNTWITDDSVFKHYVLVVDCANGSYSQTAFRILKKIGVKEIHEANSSIETGLVNHLCGVVDLENVDTITADMILEPLGRFNRHESVKMLFRLGRKYNNSIIERKINVVGFVFDADGDRFYRLDYNPLSDTVLVLNGDKTAFLQGRYLNYRNRFLNALYVNTVESDLHTKNKAQSLGYSTRLTAVGDKWILWRAAVSQLKRFISFMEDCGKGDECKAFISSMKKEAAKLEQLTTLRIKTIREFYAKISDMARESNSINGMIKSALMRMSTDDKIFFAIGSENSGHTITIGYLTMENGSVLPVFSGNGLKSAINTLAATQNIFSSTPVDEYFSCLKNPYPTGFKKTFYLYYTKKELIKKGSPLLMEFAETVTVKATDYLPDLTIKEVAFSDEPDLLYLGLFDNKGNITGAVYIRNSGTEDKTGITIMGDTSVKDTLIEIGQSVYRYMVPVLKDDNKGMAKVEISVLSLLYDKGPLTHLELEEECMENGVLEMLLPIMENKELFIQNQKNGYALTDFGKSYITSIRSCP